MYNNLSKPENNVNIILTNEPYIKLYSNSSEGCTVEIIEHKNNFDTIKLNKGSKSTFGKLTVNPKERYILYKTILLSDSKENFNIFS
jgi:hypothetical protein